MRKFIVIITTIVAVTVAFANSKKSDERLLITITGADGIALTVECNNIAEVWPQIAAHMVPSADYPIDLTVAQLPKMDCLQIINNLIWQRYDHVTARARAKRLSEMVADGKISWAELGEEAGIEIDNFWLTEMVRHAGVNDLRKSIASLRAQKAERKKISLLLEVADLAVEGNETSWVELGITHKDLSELIGSVQ